MYRYMAYLVCVFGLCGLWFDRGTAIGGFLFSDDIQVSCIPSRHWYSWFSWKQRYGNWVVYILNYAAFKKKKKKKIATCWWHIVLQVTGLNWSLYLIMTIHSSWIPTLYSEFVLNVKRAFNILNLLIKKVHNLWCFDPTLYTFRFEICYICIPFMKFLHCTKQESEL